MRVLAIDPGLTRCGIGVIESNSMSLVAVGVLKSAAEDSIETRLMEIDSQIREWITLHNPDVIAIEFLIQTEFFCVKQSGQEFKLQGLDNLAHHLRVILVMGLAHWQPK